MHQMHRFENGEPYALLVLRLRVYFVQDILDAIKSTPQESIILFNDQGEVIESDMSEYAGFGAEEALGYAERLSGTISGHTHENGCYWFYRSVSGGKLNIVQAMPDSAIRSSLEGTLVSGIFVAILAVAASMLFSAIVSRVISRPIVELANTMRSSTFEDNVLGALPAQRRDRLPAGQLQPHAKAEQGARGQRVHQPDSPPQRTAAGAPVADKPPFSI